MELREIVDIVVITILGFMSIVALAVIINRIFFIKNIDVEKYQTLDECENALTKYMHILASIGANAPYIGLLGTVMGIMSTFAYMGMNATNVENIMAGLSSALLATGLGLFLAIPSVLSYNFLLRSVKNKLLKWKLSHGRE